MDQQRLRLININQITTIAINSPTTSLKAYLDKAPGEYIVLGTYSTVDKCKKVLAMIHAAIVANISTFTMPLGSDV